jgi:hypothetical protein
VNKKEKKKRKNGNAQTLHIQIGYKSAGHKSKSAFAFVSKPFCIWAIQKGNKNAIARFIN